MNEPVPASRVAARREAGWLFALALAVRLLVAVACGHRFPPADDGSFYHTVATRIAAGAGYTWAWPDGAVTYAAHYPVGYPALLGAVYRLFGAAPVIAMVVNAFFGALMVFGVHSCALRGGSLARARLAALSVALHPTLVLYTAAVMTEAVAASVLVLLTALALFLRDGARGWGWRVLLGLAGAFLVLIRPQLLPILPLLGAVSVSVPNGTSRLREFSLRLRVGAAVLLVALAGCAPWTLRNCAKMDGCVFVSANGGWNLLIGTLPEGRGTFAPIVGAAVPPACREVYGEAAKDRCFGHAGAERILAQPLAWVSLAPQKLGQLFNNAAVAGPYLQTSNPALISDATRFALSAFETFASRLLLLGACAGLLRAASNAVGRGLSLVAAVFALTPWAHLAQLALLAGLGSQRPGPGRRPLAFLAVSLLAMTIVTHTVFFGAPRYALIGLPWLALLMTLRSEKSPGTPEGVRVF